MSSPDISANKGDSSGNIWDEVVDQADIITTLTDAATGTGGMTHAWLITGPPGSGRSLAARAFAAHLQTGDPSSPQAAQAFRGLHPDITRFTTDKLIISIEEARELVEISHRSPSDGSWRIIIIEDADRIAERTSNVLLKAIEEPPERTVWILCAPSPADMLPTIRSRCRILQLRTPRVEAVAKLLNTRDGVDPDIALQAARAAQAHVGVARRLALDESAREARTRTLLMVLRLQGVAKAITAASEFVQAATEQANASHEAQSAAERAELRRTLGIDEGQNIPPGLRAQFKNLEDEQKRRSRRAIADAVDVALVDVLSAYRDVLMVQLGTDLELVNEAMRADIETVAARTTPEDTLRKMDAVGTTRHNLSTYTSAAVLLAMESLFLQLRTYRRVEG